MLFWLPTQLRMAAECCKLVRSAACRGRGREERGSGQRRPILKAILTAHHREREREREREKERENALNYFPFFSRGRRSNSVLRFSHLTRKSVIIMRKRNKFQDSQNESVKERLKTCNSMSGESGSLADKSIF